MNLSLFLFLIGILGFILNRKNLLLLIISIEIMLLAVTLLIIVSSFGFDDNIGQTFGIYIIAIAGAESVIGLSILVAYYRLILLLIKNLKNKFILYLSLLSEKFSLKFYKEESNCLVNRQSIMLNRAHPNRGIIYRINANGSLLSPLFPISFTQDFNNLRKFSSWSGMSKIERESKYIYPVSRTIQVTNNKLYKILPPLSNNNLNALVVYGEWQGSVLGYRLSQTSLNGIFLTREQKE